MCRQKFENPFIFKISVEKVKKKLVGLHNEYHNKVVFMRIYLSEDRVFLTGL
jgi:hypothetical protein